MNTRRHSGASQANPEPVCNSFEAYRIYASLYRK